MANRLQHCQLRANTGKVVALPPRQSFLTRESVAALISAIVSRMRLGAPSLAMVARSGCGDYSGSCRPQPMPSRCLQQASKHCHPPLSCREAYCRQSHSCLGVCSHRCRSCQQEAGGLLAVVVWCIHGDLECSSFPLGCAYLGRFCIGCRLPSILWADFFMVVEVCRYILCIHILCLTKFNVGNWVVFLWSVGEVCLRGVSSRSVCVVCTQSVCGFTKKVFFCSMQLDKKRCRNLGLPQRFFCFYKSSF